MDVPCHQEYQVKKRQRKIKIKGKRKRKRKRKKKRKKGKKEKEKRKKKNENDRTEQDYNSLILSLGHFTTISLMMFSMRMYITGLTTCFMVPRSPL